MLKIIFLTYCIVGVLFNYIDFYFSTKKNSNVFRPKIRIKKKQNVLGI